MRINLGNGTVDLEKAVRLIKPARPGVPVFMCEGTLSEPLAADMGSEDVLRFDLVFHGGARVEWVPAFGDVLENVDPE